MLWCDMKCDKCGGLVLYDEPDELKCVSCSKRYYRTNVRQDLIPVREEGMLGYCKWIGCLTQTKGAYCSDHAVRMGFESAVESREVTQSITTTQTQSVTKKVKRVPKPLSVEEQVQVDDAQRVVQETIHRVLETPTKPTPPPIATPPVIRPSLVWFDLPLDAASWQQFVTLWQERYAYLRIETIEHN